ERGDIWLATRDAFVHLRDRQVLEQIPWSALRPDGQAASAVVVDPVGKGLWLGFNSGGLVRVVDGRVHAAHSAANGLGAGRVSRLRADADGAVWASTQTGLSRIKDARIATLDARDGLPCDDVLWSLDDDVGSMWVFMSCGLVRLPRIAVKAWTASI